MCELRQDLYQGVHNAVPATLYSGLYAYVLVSLNRVNEKHGANTKIIRSFKITEKHNIFFPCKSI